MNRVEICLASKNKVTSEKNPIAFLTQQYNGLHEGMLYLARDTYREHFRLVMIDEQLDVAPPDWRRAMATSKHVIYPNKHTIGIH